MRRLVLTLFAAAALATAGAGPALGDFPEQPGNHVQNACTAVASNPGTSPGGAGTTNMSPTATAIVSAQYADACLGQ